MSRSIPSRGAGRLSRRSFLASTAGVAMTAGLAACSQRSPSSSSGSGGSGAANSKKIAFAQPDTSASIYPPLLAGALEAGKTRGYEILQSHANHQIDKQIAEINTWIGERIGGMIVLPLDNDAMLPLINKAHDAGVKFLSYSDNALAGVDGYEIFDNLQGAKIVGEYVGKWVNEKLGGQAEVALLTHEVQKTGRDRIHGGLQALQRVAPGAKVVASHEGVLAAECLPVVQSMLQAHPDLNVILCIADDGCLGARQAFLRTNPDQARKDKMIMAGWDGSKPVLEAILAGDVIRATGVLDAKAIGAESIEVTANAIEGKQPTGKAQPYLLATIESKDVINRVLAEYS
jgi:ABC-type sugar transport system substrate-binding protein